MVNTKSIQPRRQRLARYRAPLHIRRKHMAAHLSEELLLRYNRRSLPVITGDEVKVMRGGSKGKIAKVIDVDTKRRKVIVEGVTHKKADGTEVALPVDPSNLLIVKLNLEDKRRRAKVGETQAPAPKKEKPAKGAAKAAAATAGTSAEADADATAETEPDAETTAEPDAGEPRAVAADTEEEEE